MKAKYTKEERNRNILGDEKEKIETNKKIEKFLSMKLLELKVIFQIKNLKRKKQNRLKNMLTGFMELTVRENFI